jgi:adenylosuccinate synthase
LINEKVTAFIGSGVVVHVPSLFNELDTLERKGLPCASRLKVSDRAHLVLGFHQIVDGLKEVELGGSSIGTTRKGIGPAYSSKASRSGLRVHHLYDPSFPAKFRKLVEGRFKRYGHFEFDTEGEIEMYLAFAERLRPHIVDGPTFLHNALKSGKRVLVEGANALMLDIDYGTYPFVTSSATTIGGVCTGLGLPPQVIKKVIGVVKAYTTRVGGGPFPTEDLGDVGNTLQEVGAEYGTTTGRRRRCGWLDLVVMRYSNMINGYTSLNLTKLDVLDGFEEIKVAVGYKLDGVEVDGFPGMLTFSVWLWTLLMFSRLGPPRPGRGRVQDFPRLEDRHYKVHKVRRAPRDVPAVLPLHRGISRRPYPVHWRGPRAREQYPVVLGEIPLDAFGMEK